MDEVLDVGAAALTPVHRVVPVHPQMSAPTIYIWVSTLLMGGCSAVRAPRPLQ